MNSRNTTTARSLALSLMISLSASPAQAQRQPVTNLQTAQLQLPNTLQLKVQGLPAFTAPPIFKMADTATATRLLSGNTQWLTPALLDANRVRLQQDFTRDLQSVKAAQRPEFQALLNEASRNAFTEPKLTVQTSSGPLTVKLMTPAVGLRAAADTLRDNRAQVTQLQFRQTLQDLQLPASAISAVNDSVQADQPGVKRADRIGSTLSDIAQLTLKDRVGRLSLAEPEGTADHLDTYNPGKCSASANGLFRKYSFPLKALLPEVKSQGGRGTCWAFATVGAAEIAIRRDFGRRVNLSEADYVAYTKVMYRTPDNGDGDYTDDVMKLNSQNNYRFALENVWQYNKSFQRTETETAPDSGKWIYQQSCADYPFQNQCEDTVSQAESGCITTNGKTVCGSELAQTRTAYGLNTQNLKNFWDWNDREKSLAIAALSVSGTQPVLLMHDARYLHYDVQGFAVNVPYSAASNKDANGKWTVNDGPEDVNWWNHVAVLVGFISNEELKKVMPDAPPAPSIGYFIMKNSWGDCWADGGYIYLSWDWMRKYTGSLTYGLKISKN